MVRVAVVVPMRRRVKLALEAAFCCEFDVEFAVCWHFRQQRCVSVSFDWLNEEFQCC